MAISLLVPAVLLGHLPLLLPLRSAAAECAPSGSPNGAEIGELRTRPGPSSGVGSEFRPCDPDDGPLALASSGAPVTRNGITEIAFFVRSRLAVKDVRLSAILPPGAHVVYQASSLRRASPEQEFGGRLFIWYAPDVRDRTTLLRASATLVDATRGATIQSDLLPFFLADPEQSLPPVDRSGPVPVRDVPASYR